MHNKLRVFTVFTITAILLVLSVAPVLGQDQVVVEIWSPENREADLNAHAWLIEQFEQANPDIDIQLTTTTWEDHQSRIQAAFVAGTLPDILYVWDADVQGFYLQGITQEINDYWEAVGEENFSESDQITSSVDDNYVGVPIFSIPHVLYYRIDLFEQAGIAPPQTIEELVAAAEALTTDEVKGFNIYSRGLDAYNLMNLMITNGAHPLSEDLQTCTFVTPEMIEVLEVIKTINDNGWTPDGWTAWNMDDARLVFAAGETAMEFGSTSFLNVLVNDYPELLDKVGAVPIPSGGAAGTGWSGSSKYALTTSADREVSLRFLEFMFQPENYAQWIGQEVYGFVPSYLPVGESPDFLSSERVEPYRWLYEAAAITASVGQGSPGTEYGPSLVAAGIYNEQIYAQMESRIYEGESPQAVAEWGQAQCERILADSQ